MSDDIKRKLKPAKSGKGLKKKLKAAATKKGAKAPKAAAKKGEKKGSSKKKKGTKSTRKRLVVRELRPADAEVVAQLTKLCRPDITPWTEAQVRAQVAVFPEGQLGVELDGELVAASSALIIDEADYPEPHVFKTICGDGLLSNHDPEGDTLYGLNLVVHPEHEDHKLERRVFDARKQLVQELNLKRITFGAQMPGYHQHSKELSPEEYVQRVVAKELRDPVLATQRDKGFAIKSVVRDYLPTDKGSHGHAALMEWHNPDYSPPTVKRTSRMRVASVQYQMRAVSSFDEFARQVEFFVDTASEYRCDFVLFPELITNQLLALVPSSSPELAARRLHEFTPQYEALFSELAMNYAINIIGGSHMVLEGETLTNDAYVFHRDGRIDRRSKIHITPSEVRWWGISPGSSIEAVKTDRGKIGIAICYDVEFPELTRLLREQGARVLFVPYNTDLRSGHLRVRSCAQARCIENHIYTVLSGVCGNLPTVEGADIHYAHSAILTPSDLHFARDAVAAEATPNVETLLVHDLDIDLLRRTERTGTVRPWVDRRNDLYEVRFKTPPEEEE